MNKTIVNSFFSQITISQIQRLRNSKYPLNTNININNIFRNMIGIKPIFVNSTLRIAPYNVLQLTSFYKYKYLFQANKDKPLHLLAASGFAGMTSIIVYHPINSVISIFRSLPTTGKNKIKNYHQYYNISNLYSGITTHIIRIVPYIGINLATFDYLKNYYQSNKYYRYFDVYNYGLGSISSTIALSITYPINFIHKLVRLSKYQDYKQENIKKIIVKNGPLGFYKGFIPRFISVIPAMGIIMLINERIKKFIKIT